MKASGIPASKDAHSKRISLGPDELRRWNEERYPRQSEPTIMEVEDLMRACDSPVMLNVYAVGHKRVIENINRTAQNFLGLGGVFHGAIEVYGQEWSFGGSVENVSGIFSSEPRRCEMHTYRQSIFLGDCDKSPEEVEKILRKLMPAWKGPMYDLLHKNCCSFSDVFAQELGVGKIPKWVHSLADAGATIADEVKQTVHTLHVVKDEVLKERDAVLIALKLKTAPPKKPKPALKAKTRVMGLFKKTAKIEGEPEDGAGKDSPRGPKKPNARTLAKMKSDLGIAKPEPAAAGGGKKGVLLVLVFVIALGCAGAAYFQMRALPAVDPAQVKDEM